MNAVKKERLLFVIDDSHADVLLVLRAMRAIVGWRVEVSYEAQAGVDRVTGGLAPDVILVDLRMPAMDGIETVRALRETNRSASIIVWSTSEDPDDTQTAIRAGASGFVTKPARLRDFETTLRDLIRRYGPPA